MKFKFYILILLPFFISCQMCTIKTDGTWYSDHTNLELIFDENWKLIVPYYDTEKNTMVGIKDNSDDSSFIVTIKNDVSKEQVSNELYFDFIKDKMINASPDNKLLYEEEIDFKEDKFQRLVFLMHTKYGEMIQNVYINRDGVKSLTVQFVYPALNYSNPPYNYPPKFELLLDNLKF